MECEQCHNAEATVYAVDPIPGGWGGHYCEPCAGALRFQILDRKESTMGKRIRVRSTGQLGTLVDIALAFGGQYIIRLDSSGMLFADPSAVEFLEEVAS